MTDVLFHVQHLWGIGHLTRTAALAKACAEAGLKAVVVSGGRTVPGLELGSARLVQLPAAWVADSRFDPVLDAEGRPIDAAWKERRRADLLEILAALAPKVLVTEMYPFGRRKFRFELEPLLAAAGARQPRPWIVSSIRDLLVEKPPERTLWMAETAERFYDLVLVHGDPAFVRLRDSFAQAARVGRLLTYTGYIANPPTSPAEGGAGDLRQGNAGEGEVVVSAGGGAFGGPFLKVALAARRLDRRAGVRWRILTGPNLPEAEFSDLTAAAPERTVVERSRRDFQAVLARCRASISLGGYNTVLEVLGSGAPAVVAPFSGGQESEQLHRARLLAARGLLEIVEEPDLTPERLARALSNAVERGRRAPPQIETRGAGISAGIIARLATEDPPPARPVAERHGS
jgi:predicted glycosyltransferase